MKEIEINMVINCDGETDESLSQKFAVWVESNGWSCGGGVTELHEDGTLADEERLLEKYYGPRGSELRTYDEAVRKQYPTRTPLGSVLFKLHEHAEICHPEEIVYREKDVVELLTTLGHSVKFGDEK